MNTRINYRRSPDKDDAGINHELKRDFPVEEDKAVESPLSDSPKPDKPGKSLYPGSHAENYNPENTPDRNPEEDGPSGENTKNGGERGGGLWTSGGTVTSGSGMNDDDV